MVITPRFPCCTKLQQGRLNTRVSFGSAQPSSVGQISVGANIVKAAQAAATAFLLPEKIISCTLSIVKKKEMLLTIVQDRRYAAAV
jgi:hypothetical protein